MNISIDGVIYDVDCDLVRTADLPSSDISGTLMNGTRFEDKYGLYPSFELRFKRPLYNKAKYAAIYDKLTDPVSAHTFILPYSNSTITLVASVEPITDEKLELENREIYWKNTRFAIVSIYPTKKPTLDGVITYGLPPMPSAVSPEIGDTYTWDGTEWEETSTLPDADNISY